MRLANVFVRIALVMLAFAVNASAQTPGAGRFAAGQILVKFKPGIAANAKADAHRSGGGMRLNEIPRSDVELVAVPAGTESAAIARYRRNPNVLYSEPNYIRSVPAPGSITTTAAVVPGDRSFKEQWALHNTGQQFLCLPFIFGDLCFYVGTADADIDGPEAWAISTGSPTVSVAVIDTGIDYTHPDLAANYAGGQDFFNDDLDPMDDHGHGTHVSGTIAAALDNPTGDPPAPEGVVGVAPNARILAYKVCGADGTCSDFAIQRAIAQAIADGAKVINMSLGGPEYSQGLDDAVQEAWRAGLVIVAGAGNDGTTSLFYPAALEHVISVGAFDEDGNRAPFSNYGDWVDISAPGNVIMSTYPLAQCALTTDPGDTGCYTWLSGTSMATPHVSGGAALVWSRPDVTNNQQVVDILLGSADPAGVASARLDSWTAHGGLNLQNALSYSVTNLPPSANAGADQTVTDVNDDGVELVTLDGSASSDPDGSIVSYEWREGSTLIGSGATAAAWLPVGTHTLTLEVQDNYGASASDSVNVTVIVPNHPPRASDTSASTLSGTPVTIRLGGADAETCELSFSVVQAPGAGALGAISDQACASGSPNSDTAQVTYTPGTAPGTYAFTYKTSDGSADSNIATVTITVINRPPGASDASTSTVTGTPVTITLSGADVETCELRFSLVQVSGSGTLGPISDQACVGGSPNRDTAQITYTPGATAGTYTFTYKTSDGSADSNIATVTITVTAPPPVALAVTGISPNVVSQSVGTRSYVITGTGFATGARVAFLNGEGHTPRVVSVRRDSSTQLTAVVEIRAGGARRNRFWDVRVTNPNGTSATGVRLLTITP
jgi:thermitase